MINRYSIFALLSRLLSFSKVAEPTERPKPAEAPRAEPTEGAEPVEAPLRVYRAT